MSAAHSASSRHLVAVVVTHNRLDKLKVTVDRLLASAPEELGALVVVDNASGDGTAEWLAGCEDPRLDVLRSNENLGGAGGFEQGMRHAMFAHDPDWLVLMDDDGRPEPGALAVFHALPEDRWDAVAAAVYLPSGEICEMNRPSRNPFWHGREFLRTALGAGRAGFHVRSSDYEGPGRSIDVTSFVGFFISRRAVNLAGYPDGRYFLYADDAIYTLGLSDGKGRIGFEPGIRFEHDLNTFPGQRGGFHPIWKAYYYHRNLLIMYRMAAGRLFWVVFPLLLPRWWRKARDHSGSERVFRHLMQYAIADGLRGRLERPHEAVLNLANDPGLVRSSESPDDSAPRGSPP